MNPDDWPRHERYEKKSPQEPLEASTLFGGHACGDLVPFAICRNCFSGHPLLRHNPTSSSLWSIHLLRAVKQYFGNSGMLRLQSLSNDLLAAATQFLGAVETDETLTSKSLPQ